MEHQLTNAEQHRQFLPTSVHGNASAPGFGSSRPDDNDGGLFTDYLRTLKRFRGLILISALIGLAASFILGLRAIPIYTTRTSLDIRSVNHDFLDMRSVAPTSSDTAGSDNDTNLQTQIKLLQSDTLIEEVSKRLLAEPHPAFLPRKDMLSSILRSLHMGGSESFKYETVVQEAAKRVKVKPIGLTRLVEITCESYDPDFSAAFCNTLTATFQEQDLETRSSEAQRTSEWLTHQVADIRLRAEDMRRRLEEAVGGNGLMLSETSTSSGELRLHSLQEELTRAQADRMQQQAKYTVAHTADTETLPNVQDDPEHRAYDLKLADLRNQLAQLTPALTDENPKVIRLRAQIADAEKSLKHVEVTTSGRQANEYESARKRESLLQAAYNAQQAAVSSDLEKAAQVSMLRKELESDQQLYQTLVQRAKEAGFASALQAATIRVVDPAKVPRIPSSPRQKLAGGAGITLGALFGVSLAFYRQRNDKVLRGPGVVPRLLNVKELGVIPRSQRLKGSAKPRELAHGSAESDMLALTRWSDTFSIAAEAYRNITFSILLANTNKRCRTYVVTSSSAGEGKTTVTSNLAVALSKSRLRVVIVDGDLRRSNLNRAFSVDNDFGMRNVLRGHVELESIPVDILTRSTHISNVSIVPAGEGNEDVVEMLHSPNLAKLLARLSQDFDIVLIDTPPILHMADARILARHSDGVLLVCRAGVTSHEQVADARDLFDHDGVRLIGAILNDYQPEGGISGYYSSYHSYGNRPEHEERTSA